jgi:ferritin-like metal-binding protein YciE
MHLQDLGALFVESIKDIYDAEQQIVKALPRMVAAAQSDQLRDALENHLEATHTHVRRLEEIFAQYNEAPSRKRCKGMEGVLAEGAEVLEEDMEPEVRDAAIIAAAQRVEHYEMAVYGSLRTFARVLGDLDAARILQETLEEEGQADRELTSLAEETINLRARVGAGSFDEP